MSRQATNNQKVLGQVSEDLNGILSDLSELLRRMRDAERKLNDHEGRHTRAGEKLDDHEQRIRKLENQDKLAGVAGSGMSGDQIDLVLKAIDDSQKELKAQMDKELEQLAPMAKVNSLREDLEGLTRRVTNAERYQKLLEERSDENAQKIENNKRMSSRL